jgi:phosphatidate cytidylyltransferase
MFKQRLLTTLILVPLVLLGIYYANTWMLSAVVLLLFLSLGWEWLSLIAIKNLTYKIFFMILMLGSFVFSLHWLDICLLANFAVWGLIVLAVLTFPYSERYWGNKYVVGGLCLFVLPTFLSALYAILLTKYAEDPLVYLFLLVWAADIGAYLVGKKWGKHKLIPKVSPGKTIEGTLGGFLLSMLIAVLGYFYFQPPSIWPWFALAIFISFMSIFGDLFISMLKRRCKLKDTGQLLPGHGGVLDRLDSLIAALPFFYFFLEVF